MIHDMPAVPQQILNPPSHLTARQKRIWKELYAIVNEDFVFVIKADIISFEVLCVQYDMYKKQCLLVQEILSNGGCEHPHYDRVMKQYTVTVRSLLQMVTAMGLTPHARMKMQYSFKRALQQTKSVEDATLQHVEQMITGS